MDSIYQDIENMGKIFKVEDKAEALIEDTKAQISEIQDAVKDVKEEDKVKAFVMDSLSGNEIYTTSAGLESNLIELAESTPPKECPIPDGLPPALRLW